MTYGLRQELKKIFCKQPDSKYSGFVFHVVSVGTTYWYMKAAINQCKEMNIAVFQ